MRQIVAIDIGTSCVKVLAGGIQNKKLTILGSGSAPTQGYVKGKIKDVSAMVAAVRQAIDCVTLAGSGPFVCTYIGIGATLLDSGNFTGSIAPMRPQSLDESDGERACRASIAALPPDQGVLHLLPIEYLVDNQSYETLPVGHPCRALQVKTHVITMPRAMKSQMNAELARQSIPANGFIANSYAALLGMNRQLATGGDAVLVDLGAGTADVSVFRQGVLVYSRSLPFGGEYVTSDLMQAFQVNRDHAEGIKQYYAKLDNELYHQNIMLDCNNKQTTDVNISYDFLHDIVESRVEELVKLVLADIEENLPAADERQKGIVYLTGGCAALPSFVRAIEKLWSMPVQVKVPDQLTGEYLSPANSAAYGILCYAANHLTPEYKEPSGWQFVLNKIKNMFGS